MIVGGVAVVAASLALRSYFGSQPAAADGFGKEVSQPAPEAGRSATAPASQQTTTRRLEVVATVNGHKVSANQLAQECLNHYGEEVLDLYLNRLLIEHECQRYNITVSQEEVDAEIKRKAERFKLPLDQWQKLLREERGITPSQYAHDIIWPLLALRRLAGTQLEVTPQELNEAYETQYGPAIRARAILMKDPQKAAAVRAQAAAAPESFGELAKEHSEDASAATKGLIEPIRRHSRYQQIELAAFNMQDGEVSQVIQAGGQCVILKREAEMPAVRGVKLAEVKGQLEEVIRAGKLRRTGTEIFQQLKTQSNVRTYYEDPTLAQRSPPIAAVVNGQPIYFPQLAEECVKRHGQEVLEGTINRTLIELACARAKIAITDEDLDAEIARAASVSLPLIDGKPDVAGWIDMVTERQGVSVANYRHDSVWPTVALKKLVGNGVTVTQEDINKGFESNYGPRVRCLAVVTNNFRRAQEVWEMARDNRTAEYFGELSERYSIEPNVRALRGEVPPIRRHAGEPLLEKEAFSLKLGDLSGVIQIEERFVVLYCLGHTKPIDVKLEEVYREIYEDIYEKKQRLEMAKLFEQLFDTARIDNHLAGTSHRPQAAAARPAAVPATPR